jgi:hypothetical protein
VSAANAVEVDLDLEVEFKSKFAIKTQNRNPFLAANCLLSKKLPLKSKLPFKSHFKTTLPDHKSKKHFLNPLYCV